MNLHTTQDIWYLVASICALGVSGFLIWALYQVGTLTKQANEVVEESREKLDSLGEAVDGLTEQITTVAETVTSVTEIGSSLFGFFRPKSRRSHLKAEAKRLKQELEDLDDEE